MTPDTYTIAETMFDVGDGHNLYVHDWGNIQAKTVYLFLHGGPGSGCGDGHKLFFDGNRDRVIFFDQRGSGKSTPTGSLVTNTTQHTIDDMERIADKFNIKKFVLVGGSWGSCLALAYGLQHPNRVTAMVLRGIFTGSQAEVDFIDKGGFQAFYPDVWQAFVDRTPAEHQHDPGAYHGPRAVGDDPVAALESAYAYNELEGSLIQLDDRHISQPQADFDPDGTRIELHYTQNLCFMPDRHILENAHTLQMPVWVIQGRYDMVCPPRTAFELHEKLPNSQLVLTLAGHHGKERANFEATKTIIGTLAG